MWAVWTILAATNFSVGNTWLACGCVVCQLVCLGKMLADVIIDDGEGDDEE